mmetsp:Transcript_95551/g.249136  ORF Transcript_95551/g.249136 Transcript_95551/m.249136 type:complete len:258 (+) Transcript_95551:3-776(+)
MMTEPRHLLLLGAKGHRVVLQVLPGAGDVHAASAALVSQQRLDEGEQAPQRGDVPDRDFPGEQGGDHRKCGRTLRPRIQVGQQRDVVRHREHRSCRGVLRQSCCYDVQDDLHGSLSQHPSASAKQLHGTRQHEVDFACIAGVQRQGGEEQLELQAEEGCPRSDAARRPVQQLPQVRVESGEEVDGAGRRRSGRLRPVRGVAGQPSEEVSKKRPKVDDPVHLGACRQYVAESLHVELIREYFHQRLQQIRLADTVLAS